MIIEVDESFKKDFKELRNSVIEKRVIEKLNELEKTEYLSEISNIKKLSGFKIFYRIRIGDYRIGFKIENQIITLIRIKSRKDIYNIFP